MVKLSEAFAAVLLHKLRSGKGTVVTLRPMEVIKLANDLGYCIELNPTYATVMRHLLELLRRHYPAEVTVGRRVIYTFNVGELRELSGLTPRELARLLIMMERVTPA
ncbi:hypothetical protein [Caldivirga sp.]|uniref:hypothetical protein n=1 Tax=Caldivirga sp. TaxID=2080243 RepID=UPI0025BBCCEA|nr:hypothetical protein [Caldivirga sp.]